MNERIQPPSSSYTEENHRVGIISIYPRKTDEDDVMGGVASYTKELAEHLTNHANVSVFANKFDSAARYSDGEVLIHRCWDSLLYPIQILKTALLDDDIDVYHVQHEYYLFGGMLSGILLLPLLVFLSALGKPRIMTVHAVMPIDGFDREFSDDIGVDVPFLPVAKHGLRLFTKLLAVFTTELIVHDEIFKQRLVNEYNISEEKITIIPHPVFPPEEVPEETASRIELNLPEEKPVVLYFGFLTGYKGLRCLIESMGEIEKDIELVIAGGLHPRRKDDPEYHNYVEGLKSLAKETAPQKIRFTGFVPDEEIPHYFNAADLCVLPYKRRIASSGPRNLAISYDLPVIFGHQSGDREELAELIESELSKNNHGEQPVDEMKSEREISKIAEATAEVYRRLLS